MSESVKSMKKKKKYVPYESLKPSDYMLGTEPQDYGGCRVPVIDYLAMVRDLENLLETCAEADEEKIKVDLAEAYKKFINTPHFPKTLMASVDTVNNRLQEKIAETPKYVDSMNEKYDFIKHELVSYLDRDQLDDPCEYDALVRNWEKDWRAALTRDLGEMWFWNNDRVDQFVDYVHVAGLLPSPVKIPFWMMAADTFLEPEFHMTSVQKVALAHAIHFTIFNKQPHGYVEASGMVEFVCRVGTREVHQAFIDLYCNDMVDVAYVPARDRHGLTRSAGWIANIPKILTVLKNYGRDIKV